MLASENAAVLNIAPTVVPPLLGGQVNRMPLIGFYGAFLAVVEVIISFLL